MSKNANAIGPRAPALHQAAGDANASLVVSLLVAGADPNQPCSTGSSALDMACQSFSFNDYDPPAEWPDAPLRAVEALLAAGADPNAAGKPSRPLLTAARMRHPLAEALAKALLAAGADPHGGDTPESNALCLASVYGLDGRIAKALLGAGANPDRVLNGLPILSRAMMAGNVGAFRELLAAGANPMLMNNRGELPIEMARRIDSGGRDHFEAELLCSMERRQLAEKIAKTPSAPTPGPRL